MVDEQDKKESQNSKAETPSVTSTDKPDKSQPLAKSFLLSLIAAIKITQLYPETNPAIQRSIEKVIQKLADFTSQEDSLNLIISKKSIVYKSKPLFPHREEAGKLALKLYLLHTQQLTFTPETTDQEIRDFIYILGRKTEEIENEGGLQEIMTQSSIKNVILTLAKSVKIVKEEDRPETDIEEMEEAEGAEVDEMEEMEARLRDFDNNIEFFQNIFLSVSHLEPRHRNMIIGLLDRPGDFGDLLFKISVQVIPTEGQTKLEAQVDFIHNALNNLGEYIMELSSVEQEKLFKKLANVILSMKKDIKEDLMQNRMLPQIGKGSLESKIISHFPALDLASALTTKIKLHTGSATIIYDALDSLAVTDEKRNSIMDLIRQKLLLEKHLPKELDELFEDIDLSTTLHADAQEPERVEFPDVPYYIGPEEQDYIENKVEEYSQKSSEQEIIYTLADLLPFVENYDSFSAILEKFEEKINIFISNLDLDLMEKIISILKAEEERKQDSSPEFMERIDHTFEILSSPEIISQLVDLAIQTKEDSEEFQRIYELTAQLGNVAVENLLNRLIEEESMSIRRKILQLFIAIGRDYIPLLAENLEHEDWFVVRNIVHIFGHYSSESIPYLKKVMDHPDYRVRKEIIYSLALIQNEEAIQMLTSFLQDSDLRIQEATISQLGKLSAHQSIIYLIDILKQKETMRKNPSLILAIIKALGQIGAEESLPQLKAFTKKRWIVTRFFSASAWQIRRQATIAIKLIVGKISET